MFNAYNKKERKMKKKKKKELNGTVPKVNERIEKL